MKSFLLGLIKWGAIGFVVGTAIAMVDSYFIRKGEAKAKTESTEL